MTGLAKQGTCKAYHFDDGCLNNTFRLRVTHCGCKTILSNPLSNCKEHLTIRRMRYTEYGTCELPIGSALLLDVRVQVTCNTNGTDRKLRRNYGKVKNEERSPRLFTGNREFRERQHPSVLGITSSQWVMIGGRRR